jgi:hypothetical protein
VEPFSHLRRSSPRRTMASAHGFVNRKAVDLSELCPRQPHSSSRADRNIVADTEGPTELRAFKNGSPCRASG